MIKRAASVFCTLGLLIFLSAPALAQTGTISGTVVDAATGNPLPGVNVVVVGTQQGATTNVQGEYNILNVSPGTYDVRASFVGFTPVVQEGVNVNIDLTTQVNFEMQEETVGLEEITVQASEPIVKKDISANVANLSAEDIRNVPVASVEGVIGMQAGVRGLSVRGGGLDELSFRVDGMSMTDARDNEPFTGISYTSVEEVQVQTGGFNAEYGNVRSGLINVVTKEGPRDHYSVDVLTRYSPVQARNFGPAPDEPENYWMRPYLDDPDIPNDEDPAFVGTENSMWDEYTQRQYPQFEGWNDVSQKFNDDDDPTNDLSPQQLEELFQWYRRKDVRVDAPDYEIDGSFGGPVPVVSDALGDLRFMASYRQTQSAYPVPQARESYTDRTGQLKVTSNIASRMKLEFQGMYATQKGMNANTHGFTDMYKGGTRMLYDIGGDFDLWGNTQWSLTDIERSMMGLELTHTLSSSTFYEVKVQRNASDYWTRPGRYRDFSTINQIGPMELDERPFGFDSTLTTSPTGMWFGGNTSEGRDQSWSRMWSGEADVTSQVASFSQLKAGIDFLYTIHRSNHRNVNALFWQGGQNAEYVWKRYPRQGAAYVQNKFEFEGMVANVGLRLDYFHAGGQWYAHSPFDLGFSAVTPNPDASIEKEATEAQWALSPRLGVSFPVTEKSKFYFNYGHFRQMLNPNEIYMTRQIFSGAVNQIGNPSHPMPKTISYELGYEHSLFDMFLLRLTGYYKDISEQPRYVGFHGLAGLVNYSKALPYNYEDVRGFEVTLRKNAGRWVRGFANFTYMARKAGDFGLGQYYENPVEQREYERTSNENYQERPIPDPYARLNLEFLVPQEFGPAVAGFHPLGNWRINWFGTWDSGNVFTWVGPGGASVPGIQNNTRWSADYNLDLRLGRNVDVGIGEVQFFTDITNILNLRNCCGAGFQGNTDYDDYMSSLHLPEETFDGIESLSYRYIPGSDEPGDFRDPDKPFVPIEVISSTGEVYDPSTRALYFVQTDQENPGEGQYMRYIPTEGTFQKADSEYVDQVLENKQYIDNPNDRAFTFLNPRRVRFGLRITLD